MIKAIFLKEYIKIRWFWLSLLGMNVVLMAYIFVEIHHLFKMDHAELVWYRVLHLGQIPYMHFKFVPAITGLLIGCSQFLPEMESNRLRLSLHLPMKTQWLIIGHIVAGLSGLCLILFVDMVLLGGIMNKYFPSGAVVDALVTALPWVLAGVAAYLGTSLAMLEPGFRHKVYNSIVATGITGLFLFSAPTSAYVQIIPVLITPLLLLVLAILLPAYRYRFRKVN